MKKILAAALAAIILFSFACCGKKDDAPVYAYRNEKGEIVTGTSPEKEKEKTTVKDMNETVEIEIPLLLIEKEYRDNLDKYAEDYGYEKVELNEKTQTVTIRMTTFSHDFLLVRIGTTVMASIGSTFESEEFPYMISIGDYASDFSEIEIYVDKQQYEADPQSSLLPYTIGEYCMYYQLYTTRTEYECKVTVIDNQTNKIIHTKEFNQNNLGEEPTTERTDK